MDAFLKKSKPAAATQQVNTSGAAAGAGMFSAAMSKPKYVPWIEK